MPCGCSTATYLEGQALGTDLVNLLLFAKRVFVPLRPALLGFRGRILVVVAHVFILVAHSIVSTALLPSSLLEQHILVRFDLDLLVLQRRQDTGASTRERPLLVLEDAVLRRDIRLRFGGRRVLRCVRFALALCRSVRRCAPLLLRRSASLLCFSFDCAHCGCRVCR